MSKVVFVPVHLSDRLETQAAYQEAKALLADTYGIEDPDVLAIFDAKAAAANQAAAADLAEFGLTDDTGAARFVNWSGATYAIDPTTSPATLVLSVGVDADMIPVAGSMPMPEPTPIPEPMPEPTAIDPATGLHLTVDPNTGMPYDPAVNPDTGLPFGA